MAIGPLVEPRRERLPLDELHDHDELIVGGECRAERGDVRMAQAGEQLDLTLEPGREILTPDQIREQDLHRLDAIGDHVADPEHAAHAAAAQLVEDFVIAHALLHIHLRLRGRAHCGDRRRQREKTMEEVARL